MQDEHLEALEALYADGVAMGLQQASQAPLREIRRVLVDRLVLSQDRFEHASNQMKFSDPDVWAVAQQKAKGETAGLVYALSLIDASIESC